MAPFTTKNFKNTHRDDNAANEDGKLIITARKINGVIISARLESKQAWKYGYFEIRAKVPGGRDTWPSIWKLNESFRKGMATWPAAGEIDIMENMGFDQDNFHCSLNSAKYNWMKPVERTKAVSVPNAHPISTFLGGLEAGHESFSIWTVRLSIRWSAMGDSEGWPYSAPFYLVLNLAIGGTLGGRKGVDDAIFPAKYYVEYVRIYQ